MSMENGDFPHGKTKPFNEEDECMKCHRPGIFICQQGHRYCGYHGKEGCACPIDGSTLKRK